MIPKKLRLKNFLSYGNDEQELDFNLFQLAVLTGENGAGKSSLIEAIPFCIWGEGRERNAELIRKGAKEARIELEFELQNNIYRVTRILKAARKGASHEVEFAIYDESIKDFRSLTQGKVGDTATEIQKRVGITYETFANSAFFAQGKADAFIKNGATDRRRILGEILGLSRYEALSEKAKQKAKLIEGKINLTLVRIENLKLDVDALPQLRIDYQAKLSEEQNAKNALVAVQTSLADIDYKLQCFQKDEKDLAVLNDKIDALKEDVAKETTLLDRKKSEVSAIDKRLQTRDALLLKQRQRESLKKEIESLDEKQSRAQDLKESILKLENDCNAKRAKFEAEKSSAQSQLSKLNQLIEQRKPRIAKKEATLDNHRRLQAKLDALKEALKRLEEVESDLKEERDKVAGLKSNIAAAQKQMDAITEKGKKAKELSGTCPLCQSPIDESHIAHIVQTYREEYRVYQTQKANSEAALQEHQQNVSRLETELAALKKKEREKNQCEIDLNGVVKELQSIEEAEKELRQFDSDKIVQEARAKEAEDGLRSLAPLEDEIASLQSELSAIGYDAQLHQRKKLELKSLDSIKIDEDLAALDNDAKRRNDLIQEISEHRAQLDSLQRQLATKHADCDALRAILKDKPIVQDRKQRLLKEKSEKEKHLLDVSSARRWLERDIAAKEEKETLLRELEREIAPQRETLALYNILAEAYSVRGVQNLLLEKAIPEIERIANEILSGLTRNLFSLSIQTERQTQNNATKPTLDIIISDANGNTRLYETFSGGERFRIDFALRLALSKYLSNISGTPIKMLVIDEGFGTQDDFGIEMMLDAMNQISDDFEKLILITHLEQMKEAFPTRIVVSKDPVKGSRFEVIS